MIFQAKNRQERQGQNELKAINTPRTYHKVQSICQGKTLKYFGRVFQN